MSLRLRSRSAAPLLCAVLGALLLVASPTAGQEAAEAGADVGQEEITRFTRAYAQIEAVREEFQEELGQTHNDEALAELREEMNGRIRELLREHELSREEYDRIHFVVMTDPEARETFQQLLEELSASVEE